MGDIAENNYNQRGTYYRDNDHHDGHDRTKSIINTRMTTTKIREAGCSTGSCILPDPSALAPHHSLQQRCPRWYLAICFGSRRSEAWWFVGSFAFAYRVARAPCQ